MPPDYNNSVFYFTESVYKHVGKVLKGERSASRDALQLFFQAVLVNTKYKNIINTHVTFTTEQIIECVKSEDYANDFTGLIQLGENIAYPDKCEHIRGDKNFKLIQCAIVKDGDVSGPVKIVVGDYETKQAINKIISDGHYPLEVIEIADALREILEIHRVLNAQYTS